MKRTGQAPPARQINGEKMKMKKILCALSVCLLMAGVAQAASIQWVGGGANSDWLTPENWSPAGLPGATAIDTALIIQGDVATVGSTVTSPYGVDITMRNGGQLTIGANMTSVRRMYLATTGTQANTTRVTHNSGTVTASQFVQLGLDAMGSVYEVGSSAAILNVGDYFTIGSTGDLKFTLDVSGAGKINVANAFTIDGANSKLTLDLSAFSGTGSFDLVTFGSVVGSFDAGNITGLTGLSGGRTASITYDSDSMILTVIPEPATLGLIGAVGIGLITIRRFMLV
jgi:hypothetical protein